MTNFNIYKLFNYYQTQEHLQKSGIIRYRFQTNLDFKLIYTKLITNFFHDKDSYIGAHEYLEAIFIAQTKENVYYIFYEQ